MNNESIAGEIDISMVNPTNELSDAVKKLTLIGAYDSYFYVVNEETFDLEYGYVSYWLMNLWDTIQKRLYTRDNSNALVEDLLVRINLSTILHTWKKDITDKKAYNIEDLLEDEITPEQELTRVMASEMLVSAFEEVWGEYRFYHF